MNFLVKCACWFIKEIERTQRIKLNKARVDQIIDIMDGRSVFNNACSAFKYSIDEMIPMN